MSSTRRHIVWVAVLWTVVFVAVAILVAGQAMSSLYGEQQACFFNFPAVACPGGDDPAIARLTFAFFGVPGIWLLGILVGFVDLAIRRAQRRID